MLRRMQALHASMHSLASSAKPHLFGHIESVQGQLQLSVDEHRVLALVNQQGVHFVYDGKVEGPPDGLPGPIQLFSR